MCELIAIGNVLTKAFRDVKRARMSFDCKLGVTNTTRESYITLSLSEHGRRFIDVV